MSRDLRGVTSEAALEEKLAALEYRMSHETLSVLEQKSILRETKLLRSVAPTSSISSRSGRPSPRAGGTRTRLRRSSR